LSAGAPPQTPLGELTALPRPHSWILGGLLLREGRGGERREGEGRGGERREGERRGGEGKGRGPPALLSHPSHYILDKGLIVLSVLNKQLKAPF